MATQRKTSSSHAEHDHSSHATTDHEQIRAWAEERKAKPSCVKGTGGKHDTGLLRLNFPGFSGEDSLQEITWDEFFEKFEEQKLALVYQQETAAGKKSNFNKLVSRDNVETEDEKSSKKSTARHGRSSH